MTARVAHQQLLDNGLELTFVDLSNRYYGDFYQIKIDVRSRIGLTDALLNESGLSQREQIKAKNRYGAALETHRELKRMGVAGPDVAAVVKQMIQQFMDTSLPYMTSTEYPVRLLRQRLSERSTSVSTYG